MPAEAEIVIEGHVLPDEDGPEGPYGDHTGYYNAVERFPVLGGVEALTILLDADDAIGASFTALRLAVGMSVSVDYLVVISDTEMFAEGLPSLLFSLRGLSYFEIHVKGARSDLHSGTYGGAVANPGNALAAIIASFHESDGRIAIPGFYDDVAEWDAETLRQIADLPHDDETYREDLQVPALSGERGFTTLERLWIRPTCDVNGILCGYTGAGAKTVLPNRAMAKVSFRLVPGQDPKRVRALVDAHVRAVTPLGVTVELREMHGGRPWKAELEGPAFDAAREALEEAFGTRPVAMGGGGSIPIVVDFEEQLGAPALLLGFSLPDSNLHAPDEWLPINNFEKGIMALALLYGRLGA